MLQAELADVSELADGKEEQTRLYRQQTGYFQLMADEYAGNVYISDMENYELLYVNQNACDVLGVRLEDVKGQKCYEVIQGEKLPAACSIVGRISPYR